MSPSQVDFVHRENRIHASLDHPHIVKLWAVFVESNAISENPVGESFVSKGSTLYMVMDYEKNGTLFNYQNEKEIFTEA